MFCFKYVFEIFTLTLISFKLNADVNKCTLYFKGVFMSIPRVFHNVSFITSHLKFKLVIIHEAFCAIHNVSLDTVTIYTASVRILITLMKHLCYSLGRILSLELRLRYLISYKRHSCSLLPWVITVCLLLKTFRFELYIFLWVGCM